MLLVVRPNGTVTFSANGKAEFNAAELRRAIEEAQSALKERAAIEKDAK